MRALARERQRIPPFPPLFHPFNSFFHPGPFRLGAVVSFRERLCKAVCAGCSVWDSLRGLWDWGVIGRLLWIDIVLYQLKDFCLHLVRCVLLFGAVGKDIINQKG
jgi:hypothetical protein